MATEKTLNQPPMQTMLPKVENFGSLCDGCRKDKFNTTIYRCPQCVGQYCNLCWLEIEKQSPKEFSKANEKVPTPALKRNECIAAIDGNEAHVEKGAKTSESASPTRQTIQADKNQRKDGAQVPDERENSCSSGREGGS